MSTDMSVRRRSEVRSSRSTVRMCAGDQRELLSMSAVELRWPVPMRAIGAQNLLTMPGGVSTAGYLHKKGGSQFSLMKWPLRYIILHKGCVYYFKSSTSASPQGAFSLSGYNRVMRAAEETTSSNVFPFKMVHFSKRHRTWLFSAASEDERRRWMRLLRREIDHYNDRKDTLLLSDSDSDADSFYGTIERVLDVQQSDGNADDDYVEEGEEEDEEDYVKPDSDCSSTTSGGDDARARQATPPGDISVVKGRPTGPPPCYPPPPVPLGFRPDSSPVFPKGPPPPVPPHPRTPNPAVQKRSLPPFPPPPIPKDPHKAPPSPQLHKHASSEAPPRPPSNPSRTSPGRASSSGEAGLSRRTWRPLPPVSLPTPLSATLPPPLPANLPVTLPVTHPATLPICEQLGSRMVLNGPGHGSVSVPGHRPGHPSVTPAGFSSRSVTSEPPRTNQTPPSPVLKPGQLDNKSTVPKPPPPVTKPPRPTVKSREAGSSLQRSSPEGQSFRSSTDEVPSEFGRRSRDQEEPGKGEESDDDYENMLLPDSVFMETTETCCVEKCFKERKFPPEDGLYAIRNSGTKTSKVLVVWDVSINKARNYRLFQDVECVFLDTDVTFISLMALVQHYHTHPLPHHGSLCLQTPFTL